MAGGALPHRAVTDRHAFAEVHLYPPIRIIGVFNSYSVLIAVGIASGVISKTRGFGAGRRVGCHHWVVSTAIVTGLKCSRASA
jgi:hypothetical protein